MPWDGPLTTARVTTSPGSESAHGSAIATDPPSGTAPEVDKHDGGRSGGGLTVTVAVAVAVAPPAPVAVSFAV